MHSRAALLLGFAAATTTSGVSASPAWASGWSRVRSAHFEVLSDAGEAPAREVAGRLERLRLVLRGLLPPRSDAERHIVVLALASRSRFEPLVPRHHRRLRQVAGFFQGGSEYDFIVVDFSRDDERPFLAVEHEYAHLALNRSLPAQPVWVAEGLAELLSGAVFEEREVLLADARADHLARLRRGPPEPLASLLAVRYDSPEYLGLRKRSALYSRSWALARWVVARHGLAGLHAFLEAVALGHDPVAAFEQRIAPLEHAAATLLELPAAPLLRLMLEDAADAGASWRAQPLVVDTPSGADVEHRLGDLLLQGGETRRARAHLERALADAPSHLAARTSLAELLSRTGETAAARRELERVLALAPDDPAALLHDARLRVAEARASGEPLPPVIEERLVANLERALDRAPDLYEAALLLAELRPQPYARRIARLEPVLEQDPGRTEVARAIAALHVKRRDLAAARHVLERARDAARDPAYRFLCEHLLARLAGYTAATEEVRGRLVKLECRADGSLRFTLEAAAGPVELAAASARSFLVYGADDASDERELLCGVHDRPAVVRFRRTATEAGGVQGSVLWLALPGQGGD